RGMMQKRKGIPVSPGIAVSTALVLPASGAKIGTRRIRSHQVDGELNRLARAMTAAGDEILAARDQVSRSGSEAAVRIIETHLFLLDDRDINREIIDLVGHDLLAAESAVERVFGKWEEELRGGALAGRAEDVADVCARVLRSLVGSRPGPLRGL